MIVYRDSIVDGNVVSEEIVHIMECTYSGTDMGERKVVATVKWPTPIDFKIGDYIELRMQTLNTGNGQEGIIDYERFYIYTQPVVKKNARSMSSGEAFEYTVTFYPRQYELACVQMRDCIQQNANADTIIYTGFDSVSFVGGAHELMERVMACLAEVYHDNQGNPLWSYEMAESINEDKNTSLERFPLSFSGNSVMDAILKLNDKEGINTTFYINGRTIFVGFKRPYFCRVTDGLTIDTNPQTQIYNFMYGKTSHLPVSTDHGGLFNITKTPGTESPITKLYAYGASRNLNRYYCSDRIRSGRYVNRLMLPSFDDDGRTDYVISQEGVDRYGIREASKQFENIYPSLRYMTYGDLRQIKYCIKVKASGKDDAADLSGHSIADSTFPIVRIQCYRVVESATAGVNMLVEAAPPEDIAVMIHATGKVVKTILYGAALNSTAIQKQQAHDAVVPTYSNGSPIPGSCYAVHDPGFDENPSNNRAQWFTSPHVWSEYEPDVQEEINTHQITYADTFWLTDLYVLEYNGNTPMYRTQEVFNRDGYSAWAWPRINSQYSGAADSTTVNEIVAVEPIVIEDTSWNIAEKTNQQYFDIYLKDVGFKIDEQNDFGEMVFIVDGTLKVSVLDGLLTGREFEVSGKVNDSQFSCVCAYNDDGTVNDDFINLPDSPRTSTGSQYARAAREAGAIWRIRLLRLNNNDQNYADLNLILPYKGLEMKAGDHIVFLDIFMPDIYIHAAENRLLREAMKYLDANCKGKVGYSVEFDKVRMGQQIIPYALQMREGLNIRMKDADLDIQTQTGAKTLADYMIKGSQAEVQMYTDVDATYVEEKISLCNEDLDKGLYVYADSGYRNLLFKYNVYALQEIHWDEVSSIELTVVNANNTGQTYEISDKTTVTQSLEDVEVKDVGGETYTFHLYELSFRFDETSDLKKIMSRAKIFSVGSMQCARVRIDIYTRKYDYSNPQKLVQGARFWCKTNEVIEFRRNKYYDVILDVANKCLDYLDENPNDDLKAPDFMLSAVPAVDGVGYVPEYKGLVSESLFRGFRRVRYRFYLDESFNEDYAYKPSILFVQDGQTESCEIKLQKVVEKDLDVETPNVDYVDMKVDSVTIKINDNTRPDDQRVAPIHPQPIYEIQANFKEVSQATAWAALSQQVADNAIEAAYIAHTQEALANVARRYYQEILQLRGAIFDPDGTCDQTFLQVMMMQVGADSMNYQFDKTRTTLATISGQPNVITNNCAIEVSGGVTTFRINANDVLRHYVFTQGAQGGTWNVTGNRTFALAAQGSGDNVTYPPYFICVACQKDGTQGQWIVDTVQHPVDDPLEPNYWFFNWGILTADSNGSYSLKETRGNAYMYGDNLVAGKISSIAGNSYFDLTTGNFVLGAGSGTPALSYIDGVLTVSGNFEDARIPQILTDLGLLSSAVSEAGSNASSALNAVQNLRVGGRNLLRGTDSFNYTIGTGTTLWSGAKWRAASTLAGRRTECASFTANEQRPIAGVSTYVVIEITETGSGWYDIAQDAVPIVRGKTYVLSVYARLANGRDKKLHLGAWVDNSKHKTDASQTLTSDWQRYVFQFTWEWDETPNIYIGLVNGDANDFLLLAAMQLEEGTITTMWRQAPEDVMGEIQENKNYADQLAASLQNQIDGVVDSYFMEGIPSARKAPSNEWLTNEVKARHEGDTYTDILKSQVDLGEYKDGKPYWVEQGYLSVGQSHYGKTYDEQIESSTFYCRTKGIFTLVLGIRIDPPAQSGYKMLISFYDSDKQYRGGLAWTQDAVSLDNYVGTYKYFSIIYQKNDQTAITPSDLTTLGSRGDIEYPYAGHSWRWCNAEDNDASTWHWHEIADSDAVLALQKAAEAQDTADGKRRVFVTTAGTLPTPPYDKGDLWSNATYPANGSTYNNVLLRCQTAQAKGSTTASIGDWIDSSRAISAATAAAAAATNAQNAVNNVTNDGIITHGTEKAEIKREYLAIAGTGGVGALDGSYYKAKAEASECGITSGTEITNLNTAFVNLRDAMKTVIGLTNSTGFTDANMTKDTYLMNSDGTEPTVPTGANYLAQKRDDFNALWRIYYDAEIALLNKVAMVNSGVKNLFSEKIIMGWNETYAGISERGSDADGAYIRVAQQELWYEVCDGGQSDILQGKVDFEAGKQYCLKVMWKMSQARSYDGLGLAFVYSDNTESAYMWLEKNQTTAIEQHLVSAAGKTVVGIRSNYGDTSPVSRIYAISLTEGARVPEGWIVADEDNEIGGENLANYDTATVANMTKDGNGVFTQVTADTKTVLNFVIDDYHGQSGFVSYVIKNITVAGYYEYKIILTSAMSHLRIKANGTQRDSICTFILPRTLPAGTKLVVSLDITNVTQGSFQWKNVMIQIGTKATAYQPYVEHLTAALNGSTDVAGGLVMTNVLLLKDENGAVTAGMSGLSGTAQNPERVLMFGGGTYAEASYAADHDYKKSSATNAAEITTLFRKDGTGKIGIFRIGTDQVLIKTTDGSVVIDDDEGISILDSNNNEKVLVTPKEIDGYISAAGTIQDFSGGRAVIDFGPVSPANSSKRSYITVDSGSTESGVIPRGRAKTFSIVKGTNKVYVKMTFGGSISATSSVPGMYLRIVLVKLSGTGETNSANEVTLLENATSVYGTNLGTEGFYFENVSPGRYCLAIETFGVNPSISANITYNSFSAQASVTVDEIDPKTVIGSNGLLSLWSNRAMFAIKNQSVGQQVIITGLPTSASDTATNGLWNNNGYLRIKT